MIYIDPPYNTGNKDFVYNDTFKWSEKELQEKLNLTDNEIKQIKNLEGKSSHSAWLSFMYPRLRIARDLLTDDGVIFISIDDNEMANLKLLCDEIFGESNFVDIAPRKTRGSAKTQSEAELQTLCDYVLIYWKNKNISKFNLIKTGEKEFKYIDEKGRFDKAELQYSGMHEYRTDRPNLYYPIYIHENELYLEKQSDTDIEFLPKQKNNKDTRWRWSKKKFIQFNDLLFVEKGKIYIKNYLTDDSEIDNLTKHKADFTESLYFNTNGTQELNRLFGIDLSTFHPKPLDLIKTLINMVINKNDNSIILDFFAGSGTTGQAVMELNKEDGGNRKFILCQLDEEIDNNQEVIDFCKENNLDLLISNLTIERIKIAGKELKESNNNLDTGFKVFECKDLEIKTINDIIDFDVNKEELLTSYDMVTPFENKKLNSSGIDTLLTTWLFNDGFNVESKIDTIKFNNNIEAYNIENKLYIFNWNSEATKELLNKIGLNQLKINEIIVYMYGIDSVVFIELRNNLKSVLDEHSIKLIERY